MILNFVKTIVFVNLKAWELFVVSNLIQGMIYYENDLSTFSLNSLNYIAFSQLICLLLRESFPSSLLLVKSELILTWGLLALKFYNKPGLHEFKLLKSQLKSKTLV